MDDNSFKLRIQSRRFILASVFTLAGCAGLFLDKINGEQFYWLAAVVLSVFGASHLVKSKFEQ